ncbi:MAG: type II toxin-antitoxin system VapC family toxin [Gammaproteobacteria bacterium]|nr:MAG: type II toxin-antitoxin system VapC family toxin [Gammaproteobacteria bacterium]
MKYLLDTCVISDFIKGEQGTLIKIKSMSPKDICISTVTIMEIQFGLMLNPARAQKIKHVIHDFTATIHIIDFNQDDAKEAAIIRSLLKQKGCPIGSYDVLLAGTALNRKLTLISANLKEFNRVEKLMLENWRGK